MTSYQMAIRWLLDQPYVDTVNVGMDSFAEYEEDVNASSLKMTALGRLHMERFAAACAGSMCARCGACLKACAKGLQPSEFVRAHMYAVDYGKPALAREEFLAMDGPKRLAACGNCGACERACIRGLDIRKRMREVASLV
jgi:predicted aldo/keto reductase-like oxidoreductase